MLKTLITSLFLPVFSWVVAMSIYLKEFNIYAYSHSFAEFCALWLFCGLTGGAVFKLDQDICRIKAYKTFIPACGLL